jgi:hypothetical protein
VPALVETTELLEREPARAIEVIPEEVVVRPIALEVERPDGSHKVRQDLSPELQEPCETALGFALEAFGHPADGDRTPGRASA